MVKSLVTGRTDRPKRILVVDDDEAVLDTIVRFLGRCCAHDVAGEHSSARALALTGSQSFDLVLLDMRMPGVSGVEMLRRWDSENRRKPTVLVITGYSDPMGSLETFRLGVAGYLRKPLSFEEVLGEIGDVLGFPDDRRHSLVGASPQMRQLRKQIRLVAASGLPVLIEGETGTGKELVARELHRQSGRGGSFVAVNCAALVGELVPSELFGHERGAFTGATSRREGRFETADRGTLLLDEVGEIDGSTQARLLRVLQEGEFEPVGSSTTVRVDVRVLAATNRRLWDEVEHGRFRRDLYHRLEGCRIETPPLRELHEDVPLLCGHLLYRCTHEWGLQVEGIAPEALHKLQAYHWPGNVRELENVLRHAATVCSGGQIRPQDLDLQGSRGEPLVGPGVETLNLVESTLPRALQAFEKRFIERALARCEGNVMRTAESIGVARRTLYKKMARLKITTGAPPDTRDGETEQAGQGA